MFKFKKSQKISEFKEKRFIFQTAGTAGPSAKEAEPTREEEKVISPTTEFKKLLKSPPNAEATVNDFKVLKENKDKVNFADAFLYVKSFLPFADKLSNGNKKLNELIAGNLIESFNNNIPQELKTKLESGEIEEIKLKNEGENVSCEIDGRSFEFPIESKKFEELEKERNKILNNPKRQEIQTEIAEELLAT